MIHRIGPYVGQLGAQLALVWYFWDKELTDLGLTDLLVWTGIFAAMMLVILTTVVPVMRRQSGDSRPVDLKQILALVLLLASEGYHEARAKLSRDPTAYRSCRNHGGPR